MSLILSSNSCNRHPASLFLFQLDLLLLMTSSFLGKLIIYLFFVWPWQDLSLSDDVVMMSSGKNEFLLHFSLTNSQVYYEYSGSMRKCFMKNSKIVLGTYKI